jgi:hypothetical protein
MKQIFYLLTIILPSIALSQSNYRAAYAVKNNGDTLRGYMNYREWRETPKSIDFKREQGSKEIIELNPKDVKYISFKGLDSYVSYTGPLSIDKNSYPNLLNRLDTSVTNDVVFLKVIIPGEKVALFINADEIKSRLFIKEAGALPQELKYHQYYNEAGDKVLFLNVFRKQLAYLINKYSQSPQNAKMYELLQGEYNLGTVEKIVLGINGMASQSVKKQSVINYFAGVGANYTTTNFTGPGPFGFSTTSSTTLPTLNAGFDFFSNPNFQTSFFRAAMSFSAISPTFTSVDADYKFTQYSIGLIPQYIFNIYNTDKLKYFIGAGVALNYAFYTSTIFVNKNGVVLNSGVVQNPGDSYKSYSKGDEINDPYDLSLFWFYVSVKTGIVLNKKIEIYAMFNPSPVSYCNGYGTAANNQSFGVGINFLINGK